MKKVFASAVAALCAAVMGVSFAGCGKSGDSADVNAEAIVGHEVTEAQWDAAFDKLMSTESVYTVHGKVKHQSIDYKGADDEFMARGTVEFSGVFIKNGKQEHLEIEQQWTELSGDVQKVFGYSDEEANFLLETVDKLEYFYDYADGSYDFYQKSWRESEWKRYHYEGEGKNDSDTGVAIEALGEACKGNFSLFHYDPEKKGYVTSQEIGKSYNKYFPYTVLKFDTDGRLAVLLGSAEYQGEGIIPGDEANISYQFVVEYTAEEISFPTNFIER